ncbi:hypothetical protein ACHMW6_06305 [Pseudoduganella sp. UC29_106]
MIILAITLILAGLITFTIKRGRCAACIVGPIAIGASIFVASFVQQAGA